MQRYFMTLREISLLCGLISSLGSVGCGLVDSTRAVATPAVGLNRTRVALGGPVEMSYRFTVAADAPPFAEDFRVFVHFLDSDGELMFSDDHDPPEPTTSWQPGQQIGYDRRMIIPVYPYLGEATVVIGLHEPTGGKRVPLAGEHLGGREYRVATIEMTPPTESVFLVFGDGWYPAESVPEEPDREWQWTSRQATLSFSNPYAASTLHLEVQGRPELFDTPQVLTLTIGGAVVETIELASVEPAYHVVPLSSSALGDTENVVLSLNVDPTFVPSMVTNGESSDYRELGAEIFYAFVELD